jgi:hypothetical protein
LQNIDQKTHQPEEIMKRTEAKQKGDPNATE